MTKNEILAAIAEYNNTHDDIQLEIKETPKKYYAYYYTQYPPNKNFLCGGMRDYIEFDTKEELDYFLAKDYKEWGFPGCITERKEVTKDWLIKEGLYIA